MAREKALREGATLPQEPATTSAAAPPKPTVAGKNFPETRLQIRMASGGQPYVTTLSSDASEYISGFFLFLKTHGEYTALREVAEYLAGQTLAVDVETVNFAMHFPRFVDILSCMLGSRHADACILGNNSLVTIFQKRCVSLG